VNFHGLGKTDPLLAAILTAALFVFQFCGIAKLVLFSQTIQAGYLALVIVAVVNSSWLLLQVDFSDVHQGAKRRTKRNPVIFTLLPL
jgi:hypothetical protein